MLPARPNGSPSMSNVAGLKRSVDRQTSTICPSPRSSMRPSDGTSRESRRPGKYFKPGESSQRGQGIYPRLTQMEYLELSKSSQRGQGIYLRLTQIKHFKLS